MSNRGVLTVDRCLSGASLITNTHCFRDDAKLKRVALIEADSENDSPASKMMTTTSISCLTGTKVITQIDDEHPQGITEKGSCFNRQNFFTLRRSTMKIFKRMEYSKWSASG